MTFYWVRIVVILVIQLLRGLWKPMIADKATMGDPIPVAASAANAARDENA